MCLTKFPPHFSYKCRDLSLKMELFKDIYLKFPPDNLQASYCLTKWQLHYETNFKAIPRILQDIFQVPLIIHARKPEILCLLQFLNNNCFSKRLWKTNMYTLLSIKFFNHKMHATLSSRTLKLHLHVQNNSPKCPVRFDHKYELFALQHAVRQIVIVNMYLNA